MSSAPIGCSTEPGQLTVITGLSGTGKSTLLFDVLHAEGQRRYVETFSPYVRQFLESLPRPARSRQSMGDWQFDGIWRLKGKKSSS